MATDRSAGLHFVSQQGELFQGADGICVPVPLVAGVIDPAPGLAPGQVPADRSGHLIRTMVESEFTGEGQLDRGRRVVQVCWRWPAPEKVSSLSPTMPSSLPTTEHQAPLECSHD
jgi:hypothetical protein